MTHTGISASGQGITEWMYDLRVFREKGQKALQPQRKIPILAAHNPEVDGSSPSSATKKPPNSVELGGFSLPFVEFSGIGISLSNILLTNVFLNRQNRKKS